MSFLLNVTMSGLDYSHVDGFFDQQKRENIQSSDPCLRQEKLVSRFKTELHFWPYHMALEQQVLFIAVKLPNE
eukprot:6214431-Pleurochrysis_carterae.AAC.2